MDFSKFLYNQDLRFENEQIKTIYDKWRNRQYDATLPIHLFGTGSEGNSVYLKPQHILIDLGLSFKRYNEYDPDFFLNVDYIILTHHHSDHLNPSTLLTILKRYPHITVILPEFMFDYINGPTYKAVYLKQTGPDGKTIYETNQEGKPIKSRPVYQLDPVTFQKIIDTSKETWGSKLQPYRSRFIFAEAMNLETHDGETIWFDPLTTKHGDIVNIAIQLYHATYDLKLLYASDLDNLDGESTFVDCHGNMQHIQGLSQINQYNMILLEANYDEDIIKEWIEETTAYIKSLGLPPHEEARQLNTKIARANGNLRHISEQETFTYIQQHLLNNGLFIPLHASSTFGTLLQNT